MFGVQLFQLGTNGNIYLSLREESSALLECVAVCALFITLEC